MSTARVKERDFIKIIELPSVRTKKAWMITLSQDVVLASGRSDDHVVVDWLRTSTDITRSWNGFIDSGDGFITLDLKLAEGLLIHFRDDRHNKNHPSQKLFLITQGQLNGCDRLHRGGQVLNSIWHELTSGVYTTTIFTWFILAKVQLHGNGLGGFQIAWFSVLNEIEVRPDEPSLMEMFLTLLRKT